MANKHSRFDLIRDSLYEILANGSDCRWRHVQNLRVEVSHSVDGLYDHTLIPMDEIMLALGELDAADLIEARSCLALWRHRTDDD